MRHFYAAFNPEQMQILSLASSHIEQYSHTNIFSVDDLITIVTVW